MCDGGRDVSEALCGGEAQCRAPIRLVRASYAAAMRMNFSCAHLVAPGFLSGW